MPSLFSLALSPSRRTRVPDLSLPACTNLQSRPPLLPAAFYNKPGLLQQTRSAPSFGRRRDLTQRVSPHASVWHKDLSQSGLPFQRPCHLWVHFLCCESVEFVTISWQARPFTGALASSLPRRVLLPAAVPSPLCTESLCVSW